MLRSMCQGGINRDAVFALIDLAYGRASSKVINDIGAFDPGLWQFWQER